MHPIRKHILSQLVSNNSSSFSKMKPDGIESNVFVYHLKQLVLDGLILKNSDSKYSLSPEGQAVVDKLEFRTLKTINQPKAIILIVCKNKQGKYLLYKRKGQPFLGQVGFPFFDVVAEEYINETLEKEMQAQFNISGSMSHKGDAYVTIIQDKKVLSHSICHIFLVDKIAGEFKPDKEHWDSFWGKIEDISKENLIPGALDIYNLTSTPSKTFFFKQLICKMPLLYHR